MEAGRGIVERPGTNELPAKSGGESMVILAATQFSGRVGLLAAIASILGAACPAPTDVKTMIGAFRQKIVSGIRKRPT